MNTRTGPQVHDLICGHDRLFVMFDDDNGIAEIAEMPECVQQALVVSLMQADGWLVENIHDANQAGTNLTGKSDALSLTAGQGFGTSVQAQVFQPDIAEKTQAILDFLENFCGDFTTPSG